jgi:hypothetical protein
MLYRVIKKALTLAITLPLALTFSRAAITVTDVAVAGSGAPFDVSYALNTTATSGKLEIVNGSNAVVRTIAFAAADLSKGPHLLKWDGKADGGATAPAGQYTARVSATGAAVPAGGASLWGPVAISANATPMWYPGVAVNHNINSPAFGHIYTTDYANDTVRVYTADGRKVADIHYPEFADGVRSVSIGQDDRIYTLVQTPSAGVGAGIFSMLQDGTDFKLEQRTVGSDFPSMLVVTGTAANRRFYVATRGGQTVNVTVPGNDTPTTLLSVLSDPALGGTVDGLDVRDSNNDPSGHANGATIYLRTTQGGTSPDSTVQRWDGDNADPTVATWTKIWDATSVLNLGAEYTGFTVSIGPDGNVWVPVDGSNSTGTPVSAYVKLSKADGTVLDTITVVAEDPRFATVDDKGNVVAVTLGTSSTSQSRGKDIFMLAPKDDGSTDAHSSPAFTFTGVVLPPIHISAGPAADASSTTATITWTTDVASSSEVFYGTSSTSLSQTATDATLTTSHSITLTGLAKTTQYFYQVRSAAANFASVSSAVASVTTKDVMGAEIMPTATATQTGATVTWTTPLASDSVVRYGTSPDALTQTATGNTNATAHTVSLSGLTSGTTYYYIAQSGSALIETTSSLEYAFSTLTANGSKVRALSGLGSFKFGLMDDVSITGGGITLNKAATVAGVDDAAVPDLPEARQNLAVVAYGGYLYAIGGRGPQVMDTVFSAPIAADGTVGAWKQTSSLPAGRFYTNGAGFGYNGYVYIVGGAEQPSSTNVYQSNTLMARQNPLDGTLGPWTVAGAFPGDPAPTRAHGSVAVYNGKVYYNGGRNDDVTPSHDDVFVADIHPDGTLTWTQQAGIAPARFEAAFAAHNGTLYLTGGTDGTFVMGDIFTAVPNPDGSLTASNSLNILDPARAAMASDAIHGQLVLVGGSDESSNFSTIGTMALLPNDLGSFQAAAATYSDAAPLRDLDSAAWQGRMYVAGGRTTATSNSPLDSTAQTLAAAITFADTSNYVANGHYESTIMDLGTVEALQTLAVTATGSGVTLSTRTAGADGVFGAWTKQTGLSVTFAGGATARYVQFALDLTGGGATAPVVSNVALTYGTPGVVPGANVLKALRIAGGLDAATQADITALDKNSDGKITVQDAVTLARQ